MTPPIEDINEDTPVKMSLKRAFFYIGGVATVSVSLALGYSDVNQYKSDNDKKVILLERGYQELKTLDKEKDRRLFWDSLSLAEIKQQLKDLKGKQ